MSKYTNCWWYSIHMVVVVVDVFLHTHTKNLVYHSFQWLQFLWKVASNSNTIIKRGGGGGGGGGGGTQTHTQQQQQTAGGTQIFHKKNIANILLFLSSCFFFFQISLVVLLLLLVLGFCFYNFFFKIYIYRSIFFYTSSIPSSTYCKIFFINRSTTRV